MKQLKRDGVALAYEEAGSGGPPLLLVHGFCGDHTHLAPQFEYFRRRHRVVAVDRRGHGQSDKPEQDYTIPLFADDLAWLCAELGLYQPVVVVHSQDKIALALADRHPELASALVLLDGPSFPPAPLVEAFRQFAAGLRTPAYREVLRGFAEQVVFALTDDPERKARILAGMAALPRHVIVSTWENYVAYDMTEPAARCKLPVLHVGSVFPADLARFAELCPQLTTGRVVGAGHFAQLEVPDQVNAMIARFMAVALRPVALAA